MFFVFNILFCLRIGIFENLLRRFGCEVRSEQFSGICPKQARRGNRIEYIM